VLLQAKAAEDVRAQDEEESPPAALWDRRDWLKHAGRGGLAATTIIAAGTACPAAASASVSAAYAAAPGPALSDAISIPPSFMGTLRPVSYTHLTLPTIPYV